MIQTLVFWQVLALSVLVYWLLPERWRDKFLFAVSAGYLASLDLFSVAALVALAFIFWALTPVLERSNSAAERALVAAVLGLSGFLAAIKYLPPLLYAAGGADHGGWIVPLGVSYYTFKLIHYAVEVSRGNIERKSWSTFFAYLFLFPTFTAGPIERYDHFIKNRQTQPSTQMFADGGTRIIIGLIKIGIVCDQIERHMNFGVPDVGYLVENISSLSTAQVWGVVLRTYLLTYVGFSAYSDVAIGASRLFGISIMENFRWPIIARNVSDYWQRWHMTLSGWCQTYVYMPVLASTRHPYLAIVASFMVMGLWHSLTATRVAWALWHAVGTIAYISWSRLRRRKQWKVIDSIPAQIAGVVMTQVFVLGSWAILAGEETSLHGGLQVLAKMFFIELK